MNKKSLLVGLFLLGLSSPTFSITKRSFCYDALKNAEFSEEAVLNGGRFYNKEKQANEFYDGCRYDISWMKKSREVICRNEGSLSDIQIPEYFFFIFDGAADFSAQGAENILDLANLDGSEGNDMGRGNMNGGGFYLRELRDQEMISQDKMQLQYYSSSGFHNRESYNSAYNCMRETDRYLDYLSTVKEDYHKPKFITLGFSNGGVNATHLQNAMGKRFLNRPADLTFTVDPIAKAVGFLFLQNTEYRGKRHPKTKRFVNLYQDVDYGSLGSFKLRGKPVKDADLNIHVTHENSPRSIYSDGMIAHLAIIRSEIVKNTFRCELSKIVDQETFRNDYCLPNPYRASHHSDNRKDDELDNFLNQLQEQWIDIVD